MKTIDLHQVDAFTDKIFGGNPAGVVTNANGLSDEEMAHIAREMNLSETVFVSRPTMAKADFQLRWFTPAAEVDFCGHATIGALYQLARLKMYGLGEAGQQLVRVETKIGILNMWSTTKLDNIIASFTTPVATMVEYHLQGEGFAAAFGIPVQAMLPNAKVMLNTALSDIIIPIASPEILEGLSFDFALIRERFRDERIVAFGLLAINDKEEFEVRGLAPLVGVDEDPFTGRLQAELVATAKYNGLIGQSKNDVISLQGHFMGRPGKAHVSVGADGVTKVSGSGAHVFSTKMDF